MKGRLLAILATVALLGGVGSAQGAVLYGTTGQGGALSTLVTIDPTTGTVTPVGAVGYAVNGMDFYNGVLYGVTSVNDPGYHGLITIDVATGAGTPVGTGWGALDPGTATIAEMAIDAAGNAYGWGEPGNDDLYAINLVAGTAARVGEAGLGTAELGLAIESSGRLSLINGDGTVYTIDPTTGGVTANRGNLNVVAHHGDVDPDTGVYYGLSDAQASVADLLAVDLDGVTVLSTIRLSEDVHTLAFVPEPTSLALLGVGTALGLVLRRRARRALAG